MTSSQVQPGLSISPTSSIQSGVTAEIAPQDRGQVISGKDYVAAANGSKQPKQSTPFEELDRRGKELLQTIATAQAVLLTAHEEFVVVFEKIYAQLPQRRTSRPTKKVSVTQDIYEWSEEAEKQTGAQIHWTGLIKQIKSKKKQGSTDS